MLVRGAFPKEKFTQREMLPYFFKTTFLLVKCDFRVNEKKDFLHVKSGVRVNETVVFYSQSVVCV